MQQPLEQPVKWPMKLPMKLLMQGPVVRPINPPMKNSLLIALLCAALGGCTVISLNEAPIEDRTPRPPGRPAVAPTTVVPNPVGPRVAQDGTYTVQRGDTLYSIALEFGRDYRELARWNGLDDPSRLQVGQALRVVPAEDSAAGAAAGAVAVPVPLDAPTEVKPLDAMTAATPGPAAAPPSGPAAAPSASAPGTAPVPAAAAAPAPSASTSASPPPAPSASAPAPIASAPATSSAAPAATARPGTGALPPVPANPGLAWVWPANGKVIEPFAEARNKGIDIAGNEGDPVLAAGEGLVVYSGSSVRGYGNLLILKHSDDFISAYAHNKQILVKQGQKVARGQRVAELGKTDADIPKLHFEIRRQGQPVDPMKYLPPR